MSCGPHCRVEVILGAVGPHDKGSEAVEGGDAVSSALENRCERSERGDDRVARRSQLHRLLALDGGGRDGEKQRKPRDTMM